MVTNDGYDDRKVIVKRAPGSYGYTGIFQINYIIYYILGLIEALLVLRVIFKLLGASTSNGFVDWIYMITSGLVAPFSGIFPTTTTQGLSTTSVLEPATIVAIIVYALVAWAIAALIQTLVVGRD